VKPTDPLTVSAVAVFIASVALVACFVAGAPRDPRRSHRALRQQ
jgi:hypothetical protein